MPTNSKEYQHKTYAKYYGTKEAIHKRVLRNAARRLMIRNGKAKVGDGKEVDHIKGTEAGNGTNNLRVISRLKNRIDGQKKTMINRTHKYNT